MDFDKASIQHFIAHPESYKLRLEGDTVKAERSSGIWSAVIWIKTHVLGMKEQFQLERICTALGPIMTRMPSGFEEALNKKINRYEIVHPGETKQMHTLLYPKNPWLEKVIKNPNDFYNAPAMYQHDRDFITHAIKENPFIVRYIPDELRNDP